MKRNIAKILTLYKQHYREKYSYELDTEYSCFGYYDGLDISEVENEKNRLSLSKGSINITDTWFGILNMAGKPKLVNGSNSQQNFVLFYTDNESDTENNEELFWKEDQAFLAVMFVQLKGNENQGLNDYINAIRRFIVEEYGNNDCKIISYRLIDNADFLLVIKGNSYIKISNIVREIQNIKSIIYVNTIFSVHSKYLKGSVLKEDETLEEIDTSAFEEELREYFTEHYYDLLNTGYNDFLSEITEVPDEISSLNNKYGDLTQLAIKHKLDPKKFAHFVNKLIKKIVIYCIRVYSYINDVDLQDMPG